MALQQYNQVPILQQKPRLNECNQPRKNLFKQIEN